MWNWMAVGPNVRFARFRGGVWSAEDTDHWYSLGSPPLAISASDGSGRVRPISDLNFLDGLKNLSMLVVSGPVIDDSAIERCDSLTHLLLITDVRRPLDFTRLGGLRVYSCLGPDRRGRGFIDLELLTTLEGRISGAESDLSFLENHPRLEAARVAVPRLASLSSLPPLGQLKILGVENARRLVDLTLPDDAELLELDVVGAGQPVDPSGLSGHRVEWLDLQNCPSLSSVVGLGQVVGIQALRLMGRTSVADGHLRHLISHPTLRLLVAEPVRRHYDITDDDLYGDHIVRDESLFRARDLRYEAVWLKP